MMILLGDFFLDICNEASESFHKIYNNQGWQEKDYSNCYDWSNTDLVDRLHEKTKNAVFTFKLRPPPREMVFLNRKLIGTYFMIRALGIKFGPREILEKYLEL